MDEQNLLRKLKKGRRDALEKAIEHYTPYVSVIVYQVIGRTMTREDMEEVISDVFLALWDHVQNIDEEKGDLRTYLGAIARNKAKNKMRSFRPQNNLEDWDAWDEQTPETATADKEEREMIWNLIMDLGEPDREIFFRYYHFEEGLREISKRTGLTTASVKTKLFRGRQKLKQRLMGMGGEAL